MPIPIRPRANDTRFLERTNASLLSHSFDGATETAHLFRAAGIRNSDHVVLIGRKTLDHLIALNRLGCQSVTAIQPDCSLSSIESADVIWVNSGINSHFDLLPLVQNAPELRTAVIELSPQGCLPVHLLEELRFKGFVHVISQGTASRKAVIASRPDWLRRII